MPSPLATTFLGAGAISAGYGNELGALVCSAVAIIWQLIVTLSSGVDEDGLG